MSREKPGIFRRTFTVIGKIFAVIRWLLKAALLLVLLGILFSLVGQEVKPLPEKAALRLIPSGVLVEQRSYADPLTQLLEQGAAVDAETPVPDLVEVLDAAARDARITSLVLDLNYLQGGGISKLEDVGQAIERFKESGKPVIAMADNYSQDQYYLASFADEIHLNPMGAVLITGYGAYGAYLKNAIDRLRINFHVFRVGEFKSAIEPFTRNNMSAAARDNTSTWLHELWSVYTSRVEAQRQLPVDAIDSYVNNLHTSLAGARGDMAAVALRAGLVDKISSRPQLQQTLEAMAGKGEHGFLHVTHKEYLAHLRLPSFDAADSELDRIGLIVASGTIIDGEHAQGAVGGDSIAQLFQLARDDKRVKAIVLRIDSPGGSAFASDVIRRELLRTQEQGIPVVASMGSLAASGGYWIAASADQIWAMPTTITGSIGVFGIVPTFENSLAAIGISSDGVGTTSLADMYHLERPMSSEAAQIIQLMVENIYSQFLDLVAKGRSMDTDEVDDIAQGRVWSGLRAQELGLVDSLGGKQQAVEAAAKIAGLEKWRVQTISRPLSFQEQILKQIAEGSTRLVSRQGLASWLPRPLQGNIHRLLGELKQAGNLNDPTHIYLRCFGCTSP